MLEGLCQGILLEVHSLGSRRNLFTGISPRRSVKKAGGRAAAGLRALQALSAGRPCVPATLEQLPTCMSLILEQLPELQKLGTRGSFLFWGAGFRGTCQLNQTKQEQDFPPAVSLGCPLPGKLNILSATKEKYLRDLTHFLELAHRMNSKLSQ